MPPDEDKKPEAVNLRCLTCREKHAKRLMSKFELIVEFWDGVNFAVLCSRFKVLRSDYELSPIAQECKNW